MGHASEADIEAGRPQLLTLDGWMNKGECSSSWEHHLHLVRLVGRRVRGSLGSPFRIAVLFLPSPTTLVSSRRNSFSAGSSIAAALVSSPPPPSAAGDLFAPDRSKSPDSCLCACTPPCVPWNAHKKTLVALNSLENKQAAYALEKGLVDSQVAKYKVEKRVLKQEVIRLRQAIQQPQTAATTNSA